MNNRKMHRDLGHSSAQQPDHDYGERAATRVPALRRDAPSTAAPDGRTRPAEPGRGVLPLPRGRSDGHFAPAVALAAADDVDLDQRRELVVEGELPASSVECAAACLDVPVAVVAPHVDIPAGPVGEPPVPPVLPSLHPDIRTHVRDDGQVRRRA